MKISRSKIFTLLILVFFMAGAGVAEATLGNSIEDNELIYGSVKNEPKYHFRGQKKTLVYSKENAVITVIYKDGISILENISYLKPVDKLVAEKDIKDLILPESNNKALFTNTMIYGDSYFKENIYKDKMKTKTIFDSSDNVKEVIASLDKLEPKPEINEEP